MTDKETMKLALEALEAETDPSWDCNSYHPKIWSAITVIKEALAQPEPPPECKTEAEQTAYAFGWFKSLEQQRLEKPAYRAVKTYHEGKPVYVAQTDWEAVAADQAMTIAMMRSEQEPVAIVAVSGVTNEITVGWIQMPKHNDKLYTTPPQRKPLTGEEIEFALMKVMQSTPSTALPIHEFARAIEAKLRSKNEDI
jgi:hypothetical protein